MLALAGQFLAQVENGRVRLGDQSMHLAEQILDAAAVFGQGAVQGGEARFLSLRSPSS